MTGGYTNFGTGLSASFTPTNAGSGQIIFNLAYQNQTPCNTNVDFATPVSLDFNVVSVILSNVSFTGGNHPVCNDADGSPYPTAQWTPVTNYPVCYTRNTTMTVQPLFVVVPASFSGPVLVKGISSGPKLPVKNTLPSPLMESTTKFAKKVDFLNPMTIDWQCSLDNGKHWHDIATSANKVYVTLNDPTCATLFHTVVHLACSKTGATDANAAVANTWSLFSTGSGPKDVQAWDGYKLTYYAEGIPYYAPPDHSGPQITTAGLLNVGNGQCTAWQALLHDTFGANGIAATYIEAHASDPSLWFLVKDWTFYNDPLYASEPEFKWLFEIGKNTAGEESMVPAPVEAGKGPNDYGDLTSQTTLWGQNSRPPSEKFFHQHQILLFNGIYYDPSYGCTYTNAHDFETKAIAGYALLKNTLVVKDFYKVRKPNGINSVVFVPLSN